MSVDPTAIFTALLTGDTQGLEAALFEPVPPREGPPNHADLMHAAFERIRVARDAGQVEEIARQLGEIETFMGPQYRRLAERVLERVEATERGQPFPPITSPGGRICDFCVDPETVAYFPFNPFTLIGIGADWDSGDRMYVCRACRTSVDLGDWRGLAVRAGQAANSPAVRLMWSGFRMNRTGPAVELEPGTDPEEGRQDGGG